MAREEPKPEATPAENPLPPETLGPYRVGPRLGRGGMGEVFRGHDGRLDRPVALKCVRAIPGKDPEVQRRRFRREARALARIRHPAVVEVYDWIETEGGDWLVMELLEGQSLGKILRHQDLPLRRALEIARDLSLGLAAIHGQGIVHRDLKPDNVMVLPPDGRVKLLDFGLAKRVESLDGVSITETLSERGQILGTIRFMSPEQASGFRLDPRSDLFSLGVLLYEMLAGVSPFRGETTVETLTRICTLREAPLQHHVPELPRAIAELVRRMLEKEPERRIASAREVGETLRKILTGVEVGSSESEMLDALPDEEAGDLSSETRLEAAPTAELEWPETAETAETTGSAESGEPSVFAVATEAADLTATATATTESAPRVGSEASPHPASKATRPWPRIAALVFGVLLVGLVLSLWNGRAAPGLDVVVLDPVTGAVDDSVSPALVAGAIRGALERRLTLLEGIVLTQPQSTGGGGPPSAMARSMAVDEAVSARFDCQASFCQIRLQRISAEGAVLWSVALGSRADDLLELHYTVDQNFRRAYSGRRTRPGAEDLEVTLDDYDAYLALAVEARTSSNRASLEAVGQRLAAIQQSSPRFLDAYVLEGKVAARQYLDTRQEALRDRAIRAFGKAHDLAPQNPIPLIALADFARQSSAIDEMANAIAALRSLIGGHPRVLALEALMAEQQGEVDRALEEMRTAARLQPSLGMKRYLGMMEYRRGHNERAARLFEEILEASPEELDLKLNLANIELLTGSPARAAELFTELSESSKDLGILMNLGVAHMLLGRWGEAESVFEEAAGLAPGFPGLMLNLADTRLMQSETEAALAGYRSVLQHFEQADANPSWQDLTVQGQALAHLGEMSAAVAAAQEAQRLAGDNPQVASEVATIYAVAGERTSAIVSVERARAAGVDARWFTFPWFDELRSDPRFEALLRED